MREKLVGLICVIAISFGIVLYKQTLIVAATPPESNKPWVLLVADLHEADDAHDSCADIIQAVRDVQARGVKTEELTPQSDSPLLRKYHVLTIPTVVIVGGDGQEKARFEGEDEKTLKALEKKLVELKGG